MRPRIHWHSAYRRHPCQNALLAMSKTLNVAVIGYGWAATAHIDAINTTKQGKVTAVWSSRSLSPAELATRHGTPITPYTDLGKMLDDPAIDVVDITSYPDQHA